MGAIAMSRIGTNTSSPSAAMMGLTGAFGLGTPMGGLGVDVVGGTPNGNGAGAVAGLDVVRDQEVERRRKVEEVVAVVGRKWGRVGQEGVERCAKRVGLDCLWEEGMRRRRTLSIAGTSVLVDVEFVGEEVGVVLLSFPGSGDGVGGGVMEGAEVLRGDLKGDGKGGYVMLDGFVGNLERLAKMDRLSGGGVSCFDAVDGIYGSLRRIYKWEIDKLRKDRSGEVDEEVLEREVMCKSSGRPKVHTNGRVGLSLQYWMERQLVTGRKRKAEDMDVDGEATKEVENELKTWSAVIECEASPAELYPSIRVSGAWVSDTIEKPSSTESQPFPINNDSYINWQEPPPTLTSPDPQENAMNIDSAPLLLSKAPDVRFIAKLEPPVVVPLQIAIELYNSVSAPLPQESYQPTTYESLLLGDPPATQPRTVEKTTTSYDPGGNRTTHHHAYTLFTQTPTYARTISEIPFSHPRQLIAILPILRQWALTGSLLRRSFVPHDSPPPPTPQPTSTPTTTPPTNYSTVSDELAALLSPPSPSLTIPYPLPIDLTLSFHPQSNTPKLTTIFESSSSQLVSFSFSIGVNGTMNVASVERGGKEVVGEGVRGRVGRILGVAEDVGVMVVSLVGEGGRGGLMDGER